MSTNRGRDYPLLPPEMATLILSNYVKNVEKNDLLNSRLVSKTWNEICVKILKESEIYTQKLNNENISAFVDFVTSTTILPKLILPLDLEFRGLSLEDLNEFNENVQTLINFYGDDLHVVNFSVSNYECRNDNAFSNVLLILTQISPEIKTLDLSGLRFHMEIANVASLVENKHLIFPKLKRLKINGGISNPFGNGHYQPFHSALIKACANTPDLEELEIRQCLKLELSTAQVIPWGQLKTLKFPNLISIPADVSLRNLISGPPVLQKLKIGNSSLTPYFLGLFAPSLMSLTLGINSQFGHWPLRCPVLPALVELKIKRMSAAVPYFITRNEINNFNPDMFPALESMELATGVFLIPNYESLRYLEPTLPNVRHLKLRVNNCNIEGSGASLEDYFIHLFRIFCNVRKITLIRGDAKDEQMIHVIGGIIDFPGTVYGHSLQEIELRNCQINYFGQVLVYEKFQPRGLLLTRLKRFAMTISENYNWKKSDDDDFGTQDIQKKSLFLSSVLTKLPNLREIQISQLMFRPKRLDQVVCMQEIEEAREKYPKINFKLT